MLPNDVILLFKRHVIVQDIPKDTNKPHTEDVNKKDSSVNTEKFIDATSEFYDIGDLVDIRLVEIGAWYEAKVISILRKGGEDLTENKLIFHVKRYF